jgi:hypothetical protein
MSDDGETKAQRRTSQLRQSSASLLSAAEELEARGHRGDAVLAQRLRQLAAQSSQVADELDAQRDDE